MATALATLKSDYDFVGIVDEGTFNANLTAILAAHPRLRVVDIRDVITSEDEVSDWSHFHRIVYYRLFQRISALVA